MKFGFPFPSGTVLSRGFYFKDPVYYLGQHLAADYVRNDVPTYGSPLVAMEAGVLISAWDVSGYRGWLAKINHDLGWQTGYAHMREKSPLPDGSHVQKGQVIGYADSTGVVTGPHVHIDLWNTKIMSPEAVAKMGYYAHDPQYWIGRQQGQEGWFDMATVEELRAVVRQEIEANGMLQLIYHVLVDDQEPGRPRWAWSVDKLGEIKEAVNQIRSILFDDLTNDSPTDKRRLIGIGQQVKASAGTRPKYGLTATEKATWLKMWARVANPQAPALTLQEVQSLLPISQKLFGG